MIESLDEHVRVQADSATRLRQSAKKQKSKRAVAENDTQVTEKSSLNADEVKKDSEELAPECRLERHMAIRIDRVKKLDSNNDRWVMALLLEALGIMGRTKWQECRSSARKMGANRIQVSLALFDRIMTDWASYTQMTAVPRTSPKVRPHARSNSSPTL